MPEPILFPSAIRSALLDDHVRLRRLLRDLEELAARFLTGEEVAPTLRERAASFRRALDAHNAIEEGHLEPLLRTIDAWGEIRVDEMFIDHLEEHKALLLAVSAVDVRALARAIPVFADDLRAHMELEERTFLSGEILADSLVTAVGPTS